MRRFPPGDTLQVIGCEIEARPAGAPDTADLAPFVRGVERSASTVTVRFAEGARQILPAFVEAERRCCAGISWRIDESAGLTLVIEAEAGALSAIETLFATQHIDTAQ
jgi:hypothetical protein